MNWDSIISSLFGAIVGGFITWKSTSSALKKQFENELKMKRINQKKKTLKSLNGVIIEIGYNVRNAVKLILDNNEINIKNINLDTYFKKNKWEEVYHNLNFKSSESLVVDLQMFYNKISDVIYTKNITEEKNSKIINEGGKCVKKLKDKIKVLENEIDEIKKDI